jgi:F-type H+-transporting ATPase subunit b
MIGHQTLLFASGADVKVDFDLSFIAQIALFGFFVVLLKPILFEPLLKLFAEREKATEGTRVEARKMDEKAAVLVQKFEDEIEKVRRAANVERDRLRAEVTRLEAQILSDAKTQSTAIIDAGRKRITEEVATLRAELQASRPALAEQIATKILGREVKS